MIAVMKIPRPVSREQLVLAVLLGGLFLLGVILWLLDPSRQPGGDSRFVSPPASTRTSP